MRRLTMSRPLWKIDCPTKELVFGVCLSDRDLRTLGVWEERPCPFGLSPSAWGRATIHGLCHRETDLARRVTDLLDARHQDTVIRARLSEPEELPAAAVSAATGGASREFPSLFWALVTDARPEVIRLGECLAREGFVRACRTLAHDRSLVPRS